MKYFGKHHIPVHSFTLIILLLTAGVAIAQTYEDGRSAYIDGDYETAYNILIPLAEEGDAEAQKMLGIMYDYGQGVPADPELALQWYIRSAEQGQTAVQYQVGAKYYKGESIPQDFAEAAKWWRMAANGGQVDAQFNLGLMYFRGLGVDQNDTEAAAMFRLAAVQNHTNAQYSLGVMYAFGRGVDRDYTEAYHWFNESAQKGVAQAQYNLGIFYENGNGVEQDIDEAREWYERAAAQGLEDAITKLEALDTVETSLTLNENSPQETTDSSPATEQSVTIAGYEIDEIATGGIKREDWLQQQQRDLFTIQIGSVIDEDDLIDYLEENNIENNSAYIRVVINGVTRYNAFYGIYDSYESAQQAVAELPQAVQRVQPWVRNIGVVQDLLN